MLTDREIEEVAIRNHVGWNNHQNAFLIAMGREILAIGIAAERERCAALCEAHAGARGTGAWVALTAAADRIREAGPATHAVME